MMKSESRKFELLLCYLLVLLTGTLIAQTADESRVNGTTGTPLGGVGAGAVKFNASSGSFAAMTQPPADAYDFKAIKNAKFQFFSERGKAVQSVDVLKARLVGGRPDDDAIWPLHLVNFGRINDIQIDLKGFSPLDNQDYDNMSLPYAFYEVTLTNSAKTDAVGSFAFQWDAGGDTFSYVAGKGISSKSWSILTSTNDPSAVITAGDVRDPGFLKDGQCSNLINGNQAKVAVKVHLGPNETRVVRFVLAWYDDTDPEIAHYKSLYKSSAPIASRGLVQFDRLKKNADTLVERMRASNLPDWLKNQTLNTLVNFNTNSMYKKDGRVAFAEGQWTCFGTMDQMWHARQIVGELTPFFAWEELRYWARTQMKNGQIHHDFNKMDAGESRARRSTLVSWDDTEHEDYRNIQKWVDLNTGFIVSTYETYQATGDRRQFDFLWPHVKRAGQRILDQADQFGNKQFPYTFDSSENSYDAGGDPDPFNANISAVAYKIMIILAKEKNETALAERYQKAYDTVVASYRARYLNDRVFKAGKHSEAYFGGQWLALHMQLGEIWSAADTDFVLNKLNNYYQPYYRGLGNAEGTYDEWTPYILLHYGGLLLNSRRASQWEAMQKDAYNRQYLDRNKVFAHPLNVLPVVKEPKPIAEDFRSKNEYISMPGLWRNYYDIVGFHRDVRTQELWLKPIVLPELNHRMTNAMYVSPEGYGSISSAESGEYFQNKRIAFKPEYPLQVSTLHLADDFGDQVAVTINGKKQTFTRTGNGYAKELLVAWNGKVDADGLQVSVSGSPGVPPPPVPERPTTAQPSLDASASRIDAYHPIEAEDATKVGRTLIMKGVTGGAYVTSIHNFDYLQFSNVDFGATGAKMFFAKVASNVTGSSIEVVLDNVDGEVVGSCIVPRTNGDQAWVNASASIKGTTGVHNLILRFYGSTEGNLMNIDEIVFVR